MPSYLITGASRGIGLAAVSQLLEDPQNYVIATARDPSKSQGLQDLLARYPRERLAVVPLDLGNLESIDKAVEWTTALLPGGLDYLVNNAGIILQELALLDKIDLDKFEEELRINTVRQVHVLRKFLPLVRQGTAKKIVFMTSGVGSLAEAPSTSTLAITYSASKTALNMLARKFGATLSSEGICVVLIHPGWVDTDMGGTAAGWMDKHIPGTKPILTQESVQGFLRVMRDVEVDQGVQYLDWKGTVVPW